MTAQPPAQSAPSIDDYQPPKDQPPKDSAAPITPVKPVTPPTSPAPAKNVESLQDQNIFYLLGVEDSTDEEKESFLDELQQVIWEDFIETDVKMLISVAAMTKLRQLMAQGDGQDVQEEMVVYLEKLIPDLEEIMLEKALELKEEMVLERMAGLREYHLGKSAALAKIDQAEQLVKKDHWHQAAGLLNALSQ